MTMHNVLCTSTYITINNVPNIIILYLLAVPIITRRPSLSLKGDTNMYPESISSLIDGIVQSRPMKYIGNLCRRFKYLSNIC